MIEMKRMSRMRKMKGMRIMTSRLKLLKGEQLEKQKRKIQLLVKLPERSLS